MRPIWKGSVSFGLVNIPIALFTATKRDELSFRLLRKSDLSPINYKRVAEVDGREVAWDEIVKGYEYEKGQFVVIKEEDFRRVDVEATETIDIIDFVPVKEVNPMYFSKPYYLEPQKGGMKAYALLRDALRGVDKIGITKVVIKTRQHLAALKPHEDLLVLELMHFSDELVDPSGLKVPEGAQATKREIDMARTLIDEMTTSWQPERYTDDYTTALLELIQRKIESGGKELPAGKKPRRAPTGDVIDLVAVLKQSLSESGKGARGKKAAPRAKAGKKERKTAA